MRLTNSMLFVFLLISCDGGFNGGDGITTGGSGGNGGGGFNGGTPDPTLQRNEGNATNGGQPNGFTLPQEMRGDVVAEWGNDAQNLYAPARVYYNGEYSGHDAVFTFYIQRVSPAPEKGIRELIQAQGNKVSNEGSLDKVCRCGKKNEFFFMWKHASGRAGALHSPMYDRDNRLQGDWIVSDTPSDEWYEGNLKGAPKGIGSMFFGADTENPAAFMGANRLGNGFLRTWHFHPNSLPFFATKKHRWDSRDDMRIGLTCDIDQCPEDLKYETEMSFRQHFSHSPSWLLP